jgi:galactose oxidase-like protein
MNRGAGTFLVAAAALAAACDRPDLLPETPRLEVSTLALSFQAQDGRYDPDAGTVDVRSVGGPLEVTGVSTVYASTPGWLSVDVEDPTSSPARLVVRPHVVGLPSGRHDATVYVNAPGMVNSPFPVKVSLDVPAPVMAVNAQDVWLKMTDVVPPPPYELKVSNAGGGVLGPVSYSVDYLSGGVDWLSVTPSADPRTLVLAPVPDRISETYGFAVLTLRAGGAPPKDVYVVLSVWPKMDVSQRVVRFQTPRGLAWPSPRTITATPTVAAPSFQRPAASVVTTWRSRNLSECEGWLEATVSAFGPPWTVTLTPVPGVVASVPAGGCYSEVNLISQLPSTNTLDVIEVELAVDDVVNLPAPLWEASTPSLDFGDFLTGDGDPPAQSFTVRDVVMTSPVAPSVSTTAPWLTAAVTSSPAPGAAVPSFTVTVRAQVAGLPAGTYADLVSVGGYPVRVGFAVADWGDGGRTLNWPLIGHTATALADGTVLLVGLDSVLDPDASFQVFDPATSAIDFPRSSRSVGLLNAARAGHSATALPDGRVLAAGGVVPCCTAGAVVCDCASAVGTWEIFEPETGTWPVTRPMRTARFGHTATALADGRVLVAGGVSGTPSFYTFVATAEILDPGSGKAFAAGSLAHPRSSASAVRLADGRVLVAGGYSPGGGRLASAEMFVPSTGAWFPAGFMNDGRADAALVLLGDGRVLAAGGEGSAGALATAELFDPSTGLWTRTASMATPRSAPAVLLPSGKVLLVAGAPNGGGFGATATLESYDPATGTWTPAGALNAPRRSHRATLLPDGRLVVTGGTTDASSFFWLGQCCGTVDVEVRRVAP